MTRTAPRERRPVGGRPRVAVDRAALLSESDAGVDDDQNVDQFGEFVELRWQSLVRFGYLLTGDWAAAEDLTQAALERTWRRWDEVRVQRPESYVKAAM